MAEWTDKQLRGHKRAQGYISSAGATLGVAALGAAGLKTKGAQRLGTKLVRSAHSRGAPLSVTGKAKRAASRAAGSAGGLTTASAGVGGIGGFNFAAIQSQEARKSRVKKMTEFEEFAKAQKVADPKTRRSIRTKDAASGALAATGTIAALAGASRIHTGRQALKLARQAGRPVVPRKVNGYAARNAGLSAAGVGGIVGAEKLTRSADREWAGAKKVRKSAEEVSKIRIPFKNSNVTRNAKVVGAVRPPRERRGLPQLSENKKSAGILFGGAAGLGAVSGAVSSPIERPDRVKRMRQKGTLVKKSQPTFEEFAKAFDPERSRKRRLENYQAGANMTAGAAGFAGALKLTQAGKQASSLKGKTSVPTASLKAIGSKGAKGAGLLAAGAGAAVGAKKIGDHRKGKGRSYKALTLS